MSVELFWRDLGDDDAGAERLDALLPRREELCAAALGKDLETWLRAESRASRRRFMSRTRSPRGVRDGGVGRSAAGFAWTNRVCDCGRT
jgi:hypothetical protein